MLRPLIAMAVALVTTSTALAQPGPRPDQAAFRAIYKELVETNTTYSSGDCTLASQRMAKHLTDAGYLEKDVRVFVAEGHPKEGGLVAVLPGSDPRAKALLLVAHIDVVEAKPEEWKRDPFKLIEEGGYFYARGASDDKAMAAIWVDTLVRLRKAGFKPKRSIKMALTCGEETSGVFKGAQWLTLNHKDWVDAEIALNEGASGQLNAAGGRISLSVESGQKVYQDFKLTIDDPGGHSARPGPENAIANLAKGLVGLQAYDFPIILNDTTRTYFKRTAEIRGGDEAVAINALLADPTDPKAYAAVARNPLWRAMLKTTCVVTTVSGGHARNAVPQHAEANVNCRIFPGISKEETQAAIEKALGDPRIKVAMVVSATSAQVSPAPPLTAQVLGPIEAAAAKLWPGVPVIPSLSTGATDGRYFNAVGIPTYGVSGLFIDPDGGGVHGLDERIRVRSLYEGREFLYDLVQRYAVQGGAKR